MKVLKKHKKILILGVLLAVFLFSSILYNMYNKKTDYVSLLENESVYKLDVKTIINLVNDGDNNFLKADDLVEIEGEIKEINYKNNRTTIFLGAKGEELTYIICDMQKNQKQEVTKLKVNDNVKLKGIFKGYLADAIFLNCIISQDSHE